MDGQPLTDRGYLREVAYADSAKLRDRISIYQYRETPGELGPWVLSHIDWPGGVRVLDVGCGPGHYLALLKRADVVAVGVDISEGMCREAHVHGPTVMADVAVLPFATASFERVLAPHMLYHCADITGAIRELRRVLAPGGTLLAVVNSLDHMAELRAVLRSVTGSDGLRVTDRITLESGPALFADAFDDVGVERFGSVLRVPEPAPVLAYIRSMAGWCGALEPNEAAEKIEHRVASVIAREGVFRIRSCAGVLICS